MKRLLENFSRKQLNIFAIPILIVFLVLPIILPETFTVAAPTTNSYENIIPRPNFENLEEVKHAKVEREKKIMEEKRIAEDRQRRVDIAYNFLKKFNSPMTPYAETIVNAADRCGGDFKTLLAIAKVESTLGAYPYKKYNPYGYLDGVQYSGWNSALDKLSCKISQQYIARFGNNFDAMGKIYAANPNWANKVRSVYNSI